MTRSVVVLAVLALFGSGEASPAQDGAVYYVDAARGDDGNNGGIDDPWRTLEYVFRYSWAGRTDGDTIYLSGTFRERLAFADPARNVTVAQWPGKPRAIVRGDVLTSLADWTYTGHPGVFEFVLPPDTADHANGRTLPEGIASVVVDWDASIDALGRHYGHLERAQSGADCLGTPDSWWFFPSGTPGTDQDGSGTVRIHLAEGYASHEALVGSGHVIAYCLGNKNGIEIGTNRYADNRFTQLWSLDAEVVGFTLDGVWSYLWPDNGWRSQYGLGGLGVDVGPGTNVFVNSMGYAIRPADWVGGTVRNCRTVDGGYHGCMFVGQRNKDNLFEDSEIWGGHGNMTSGGSSGGFFCSSFGNGSKHIEGCRVRNVTTHKYTLLGRATETVNGAVYAIPNAEPFFDDAARPITVTAVSPGASAVLTLSSPMPAAYAKPGTRHWVRLKGGTGGLAPASAIAYPATVVDATALMIPFEADASGTAGLAVFARYDGFISHTNAVEGNRVLDIEYRDCTTYESGCVSLNALCEGSAFKAGAIGPWDVPPDPLDPAAYPVRFVNCVLRGAAYNLTDSDTSVAYVNCSIFLDRHGTVGTPGSSGALASGSGAQSVLFSGCEVVDTMGDPAGSARSTFQASLTNRLYLLNCSVYGRGAGPNDRRIFTFISGAWGSRVFARGCIFGHSPEGPGRKQLLTMGVTPSTLTLNPGTFDIADCWYFGLADGFVPYPGPTTRAQWESWAGGMDPDGVYGEGAAPFEDGTGSSLALATAARGARKLLEHHAAFGLNGRRYSWNYGAYQYRCFADTDDSGHVNGDDFDAFIAAFEDGSPDADIDENGHVNGDDFEAFVERFDAGC